MQESAVFRDIWQEALQEGRQAGLEEGRQAGLQEEAAAMVLRLLP